jgi:hypothetical protein
MLHCPLWSVFVRWKSWLVCYPSCITRSCTPSPAASSTNYCFTVHTPCKCFWSWQLSEFISKLDMWSLLGCQITDDLVNIINIMIGATLWWEDQWLFRCGIPKRGWVTLPWYAGFFGLPGSKWHFSLQNVREGEVWWRAIITSTWFLVSQVVLVSRCLWICMTISKFSGHREYWHTCSNCTHWSKEADWD